MDGKVKWGKGEYENYIEGFCSGCPKDTRRRASHRSQLRSQRNEKRSGTGRFQRNNDNVIPSLINLVIL